MHALLAPLLTATPAEESLGRGVTLLYMLALVGVLMITLLLLAFSFRRGIRRRFTRETEPSKSDVGDAWSESAQRMPTPRPEALEDDDPDEGDLV